MIGADTLLIVAKMDANGSQRLCLIEVNAPPFNCPQLLLK
jgi:hypothetical protein